MPTASTASSACNTLPGPIGRPATRRQRAKCMMLADSRPPSISMSRVSWTMPASNGMGSGQFSLDLSEDAVGLAALDSGDIVLVFQQGAESVVDRVGVQFQPVELGQRLRPVQRFRHTRQLEQVHAAQLLDEPDDLLRQPFRHAGSLHPKNLQLARGARIIDPVVEAAPLQGVVDLARAVGCDDDGRRMFGLDRADLRYRDLEI